LTWEPTVKDSTKNTQNLESDVQGSKKVKMLAEKYKKARPLGKALKKR